MAGVVRTRVGYAGGAQADPTYRQMGDHTETLQIDYDPSQISYKQLLDVFWNEHDPTRPAWSVQYRSIILCQDDEQLRQARATLEAESQRRGREIHTVVAPLDRFYPAEAYHQKYRLKHAPWLLEELEAAFPKGEGLTDSTAAARLNGWLAGHGEREQIEEEVGQLGLSDQAQRRLLELRPAQPGCGD